MRIGLGFAVWVAVSTSFATPVTFVGVNFGAGGQPSPNNWTLISAPGVVNNLIDTTGASTSYSITVTSQPSAPSTFSGTPAAGTIPSDAPTLANLQSNFFQFTSGHTLQAQFTGLTPNATYNVYAIGIRFGGSINQSVTISGSGAPVMFTQSSVVPNALFFNGSIGSSSQTLESYAQSIQATDSGTITILFTAGSSLYTVAGVALSFNPPIPGLPIPNSLVLTLIALAVASLVYFARRRLPAGTAPPS